ncbi:MAG: hypothetical protein A2W25_08225 [candidate division Zixibacteria bacterium RBG_16_53_22]|nr:MAG: hypothetical protein A2W25_08225 [candidate division Zixibacteria bacterium RBG_16_53_22]
MTPIYYSVIAPAILICLDFGCPQSYISVKSIELWQVMRFSFQFLRRIKVRIALSFSLLFLAFAVPIIIYAVNQVNLFFNGLYLEQMRAVGMAIASVHDNGHPGDNDSLTARVSQITGSNVYLYGSAGELVSKRYEGSMHDTNSILSYPIIEPQPEIPPVFDKVRHRFIDIGTRRYLQVQTELPGGLILLQVKSLRRITMIARRMSEVIVWSSFLGLITLVAVAFWVSANITRPIEELTTFAQRIRAGRLPPRTNIVSPDEVGELADALNDIVDDLGAARERLGRLEVMRRDFFANVGEELKRPLQKIQLELAGIAGSPALAGEVGDAFDSARFQAQRLHHIIDTLIQISELEFGEITLEIKTVSLGRLLDSVIGEYRQRIFSKGLDLKIDIPAEHAAIDLLGDERLLGVVLRNLISNAADFTQQGHVRIFSEDNGVNLKLTVEDTGPGIPRDEIDRIFERFYRVKAEQPQGEDRTGLGLAIAKHIMEAHGRSLDVESLLGVGSKFSIHLKKVGQA